MSLAACGRIFTEKINLRTHNEGLQSLYRHIKKWSKLDIIGERYCSKMLEGRYIKAHSFDHNLAMYLNTTFSLSDLIARATATQ
jgi:hypothetical protein